MKGVTKDNNCATAALSEPVFNYFVKSLVCHANGRMFIAIILILRWLTRHKHESSHNFYRLSNHHGHTQMIISDKQLACRRLSRLCAYCQARLSCPLSPIQSQVIIKGRSDYELLPGTLC